jgi:hypothetical protein
MLSYLLNKALTEIISFQYLQKMFQKIIKFQSFNLLTRYDSSFYINRTY